MEWISLLLMALAAASIGWMLTPDLSKRRMRERVMSEVAHRDIRLTFLGRIAELLAPINRYLPLGWYSIHIWNRLDAGGLRIPAMHFFVVQEMGAATGLMIYVILFGKGHINLGWFFCFIVMGFVIPYVWLNARVQSRRQSIARDLPEVVDLLSLCVDAGLDFMDSLGRVTREFRRCPTTEELGLMIQEVRVGKRRRDALRAFSARVQMPEASSFSRTLVQADRMGVGITEALRVLSEDMRIQRYHWAERFAQQAPLKMLIPLLFSLGTALIIVAGPILAQFLNGGFSAQAFSGR